MKKLLLLCLAIIIACFAMSPVYAVEEQEEEVFGVRDLRALEDRIDQLEDQMAAAHDMAEAARKLGYDEENIIIQIAKYEYEDAFISRSKYRGIHDRIEAEQQEKEAEYPEATKVWLTLMDAGYNDHIIAGILGNMMVECGGQTLALQPTISTKYYYGICQWSQGYSEVWGKNLEEQLQFLLSTINYEFDTYGYMYKKGFKYNSFVELQDTKDAALAFAKAYERCGLGTYKVRQRCAEVAYNYFIT